MPTPTPTPRVATDSSPATAEPSAPRDEPAALEAPARSAVATEPAFVQFTPQIRVDRARGMLELAAVSVLEVGFLEQYVCSPSTREHESLFVFEGKARELHAALLLAGFNPGAPGSWREVPPPEGQPNDGNQQFAAVPPTGDAIRITVVLPDGTEHPLTHFVRASPLTPNTDALPPNDFVFAGSRFRPDRRTGVERYLADGSGSIIGLVTFGDETIAAVDVVPDQVSVAPPVWEAFTERMPKPGTRLTLRLARPASSAGVQPSRRRTSRRRSVLQKFETSRHSRAGSAEGLARRADQTHAPDEIDHREIKRPGRDKASGRALPGASWGVGVFLPRTRYLRLRFSQATDLRIAPELLPDSALGEALFPPLANAVSTLGGRLRPGMSGVALPEPRRAGSRANRPARHLAAPVDPLEHSRNHALSQAADRHPGTSA